MNENNAYILNLLVNFIFTGIFYCIIPVILRTAIKKSMEKRQATIYAIINSITIYLLFAIFYYLLSLSSGEMVAPKVTAAVLWFFAARGILRYGHKTTGSNEKEFDRNYDKGKIKSVRNEDNHTMFKEMPNKNVPNIVYCSKCGRICRDTDIFCKNLTCTVEQIFSQSLYINHSYLTICLKMILF